MSVLGWGERSGPGGWTEPEGDSRAEGRRLLIEFLLARNSEVLETSARVHHDDCATHAAGGAVGCDCGYPDMVAAECSARWRVVSLAQTLERWSGLHIGVAGDASRDHLTVLYEVMAALATAYADHPDYRPDLW